MSNKTDKSLAYPKTEAILCFYKMDKLTDPFFGDIKPDETVDIYSNLSTNGEDQRGLWNSDKNFTYIAAPGK